MNPTESSKNAIAVTPDDTATLPHLSRGLYVGGKGDLVVEMASKREVTFPGVPGGTVLPIMVNKVKATTTATDIVALY